MKVFKRLGRWWRWFRGREKSWEKHQRLWRKTRRDRPLIMSFFVAEAAEAYQQANKYEANGQMEAADVCRSIARDLMHPNLAPNMPLPPEVMARVQEHIWAQM